MKPTLEQSAQEAAEKIAKEWCNVGIPDIPHIPGKCPLADAITSALLAFAEEAYASALKDVRMANDADTKGLNALVTAFNLGKAEQREADAKIAELYESAGKISRAIREQK